MHRMMKVGLVISIALAVLSGARVADAQEMKGQMCGIIEIKDGYSITPWVVWAKGLACTQARKVAKAVAKSPSYQFAGWKCVNKSVTSSRVECTKSGQRVELGWGA